MIGQAGQWTQTPSTTPLQPKKMKCSFLDYVPFWWSAWLIDELEPHLPPLSYQKMKCSIFDYVQLLMIGWACKWTQTPSFTPLLPKNEMLIFWLCSTSDVGQTGQWTRTPSTTPSPANKMKCSFLDYVHFWWSARLVDGLKPHLPPLSSQKNEMLNFWLRSTSDDQPDWSMDSNPICHPSPAKRKWNAHFCITFNFWCWPDWSMNSNPNYHPSPAKKMKSSFLYYVELLMISRAGWWTRTPSTTHLQPKKVKCSFSDYVHFWWSAWLIDELEPHLPPLCSQKNEMLNFRLCSTSDDQLGWSMDLNAICHPSPAKKMKCSFLDYIQLLMLARLVNELEPHLPSLSSQKNEMLIFGLHSTFDDFPGWLMESNPIHHLSPAKKMKSSFLYYVELLMISRAGWWTRTPSATPLQPKKWNAHFWILFNFWWSARLVNGLKHHLPLLSSQKMKCSFLDYVQLLMIGWTGQWTQTPSSTSLQPKKWNAHFCIMFNF